jgi:hypothetical protein
LDRDEVLVFMALDGPLDTWRTEGGIARQTGLSEERVLEILKKFHPTFISFSDTPSILGNPLFGLAEKVGTPVTTDY